MGEACASEMSQDLVCVFARKSGAIKMNSDQIGGIVSILIFFVLPIVIGLILIVYARALVRSGLRFLSQNSSEQLEPSDAAIMRYRIIGVVIMVTPIIVIFIGVLATFQSPW
jgi:hypothetical protein